MGLLSKIKHMVKMSDFFYSSEMLRYENELEYRTLTGGLLSLGIIITILIGFASMIMDTINLSSITTQKQVVKHTSPVLSTLSTAPGSMFMFGLEIWRLNITDSKRYFDLTYRVDEQSGGQIINSTYLPLERCTKNHWAQFPQVLESYDKLEIEGWLCPKINSTINIEGKYTSDKYSQYIIQVDACDNETEPLIPCAPIQQIQQLFLNRSSFFYFTFYFINPVINPDSKEYKSYYLEDTSYVIFGDKVGSQTFIYFTDYTITTDYSIWPFQDVSEDSGCIVESPAVNHHFQTNHDGIYVTFNIVKSPDSIIYSRSVQKVSSVLSFMGGMIGAVSAVLFFIKIYTSVSFEISIALQVFRPEQNSEIDPNDISMDFWTFIKFQLYKLGKYVGKTFVWTDMNYIDQCEREILKQLDIKSIIKRLIFIEHCLTFLFEDYQLDGLQLKKPTSALQIRRIRQKCESVFMNDTESMLEESSSQDKNQLSDFVHEISSMKEQRTSNNSNSPSGLVDLTHQTYNNVIVVSKTEKNLQSRRKGILQDDNRKRNSIVIAHDFDKKDVVIETLERNPKPRKIEKSIKLKRLRTSYLKYLCSNAQEGNQISRKIWENLSEEIKDRVMMEAVNEEISGEIFD